MDKTTLLKEFDKHDRRGLDKMYLRLHRILGCKGCKYCNDEAYGKGPCCTFTGILQKDLTGKCLVREERNPIGAEAAITSDP